MLGAVSTTYVADCCAITRQQNRIMLRSNALERIKAIISIFTALFSLKRMTPSSGAANIKPLYAASNGMTL
ncbi:hypothetical protein TM49_06430 [Martelella endophytica]|uniref:Uncharacterized protein n=1 Tax=Martelella endophytica TaxID=1486262 RepID=A0A0D5LQ13_MAREN|nr:hypothetical protein TM49_06430 [Martelella endophytica]